MGLSCWVARLPCSILVSMYCAPLPLSSKVPSDGRLYGVHLPEPHWRVGSLIAWAHVIALEISVLLMAAMTASPLGGGSEAVGSC